MHLRGDAKLENPKPFDSGKALKRFLRLFDWCAVFWKRAFGSGLEIDLGNKACFNRAWFLGKSSSGEAFWRIGQARKDRWRALSGRSKRTIGDMSMWNRRVFRLSKQALLFMDRGLICDITFVVRHPTSNLPKLWQDECLYYSKNKCSSQGFLM